MECEPVGAGGGVPLPGVRRAEEEGANALRGIATIGGAETAVKVHLMDDKEDCSRLIRPSQWNFFCSCFSHIGIDPAAVMVVNKEEYDRVAGSRTRKRR